MMDAYTVAEIQERRRILRTETDWASVRAMGQAREASIYQPDSFVRWDPASFVTVADAVRPDR